MTQDNQPHGPNADMSPSLESQPNIESRPDRFRTLYRSALFVVGLALVSQAQALGTGDLIQRQVDSVTRNGERTAERLMQRAAERQAARELEETRKNVQKTVQKKATELHENLAPSLKPLTELPGQLPILTVDGSTVFVDVAVEGGWRAVDRQWLVTLEADELADFRQPGIDILEQTDFPGLDVTLLRFRVTDALDSRKALEQVLPPDVVERLDRNHIYSPQGTAQTEGTAQTKAVPPERAWGTACDHSIRIGMVDTAVQTDHPVFARAAIVQHDFLADDFDLDEAFQAPEAHGTAVASLLVGAFEGRRPARLPRATLYNASVFYARNEFAEGATLMHLVKGLNWLVEQDVGVINMSMAGPDNQVLATVIKRLVDRGKAVVAAVGNQGPAAPPLYPAAYPGVISATAVDSEQRIYRWANRGEHVDFAALGVGVRVAVPIAQAINHPTNQKTADFGRQSGTSMATPAVSALVACELASRGGEITDAVNRLAERTMDLGDPGRDPVFGYGLLPDH